jgi:hypothetical protein
MDANEGVQSFNFEVGQKFKLFKEFESQLKHYQDAKFIQMYRSSCKIESTKKKQTITNNDLVVDLPTKILDENINLNSIEKKITIDGWKLVKQKKQPNGTVQSVKLMFIFMHP